ncbi:sensor histidine kinase [Paenibacillus sp. GCM10027627]|uniref:sensor histidine kinase n=1 Tax=unclassified Paenibacillus TaxID=185978 RepID=UPI003644CB2C
MKWKLTGRYLASVILIVSLVIVLNGVLAVGFFIASVVNGVPLFPNNTNSPETFTRKFQRHVQFFGSVTDAGTGVGAKVRLDAAATVVPSSAVAGVTEEGRRLLDEQNGWIQILDESGRVLYEYQQPAELPGKYTAADIVQMYKYQEVNRDTIVYVGEASFGERRLSYLVGLENPYLERYVLSYDHRNVLMFFRAGLIVFAIDLLIALGIGYLFSKKLTQPLQTLIGGIRRLANQDDYPELKEKGIYRGVFQNMNQLSSRLKETERERKKLDRMKEEWISNISHDLKTPLSSIKGYAEMMKDPDYSFTWEEVREYAAIIEVKSIYIKEVIEDLSLSTRLRNKELSLNKEQVNLTALLRNTVIDVLNDPKYMDIHIEFHADREDVPQQVDGILFRRVIFNLLYNAVVHNDENVRIMVSLESEGRTRIVIRDDGKGIREEELERVFDRYYRGTNTGAAHKGSGLGMAIARDIVEAHGGEINVSSEVGVGTLIVIELG